jgi:DNA ligase-1|nr:MAG TPA: THERMOSTABLE DNA LIGASE [Caudoviricetes sp.]
MTDKELIGKLDAMVNALHQAKKKTDKTRILLDARKDFGDEADELMAFFRFLLDPAIITGLSDAKINKKVTAKPDIDIQYLSCGYLYIMGAGHNTGSDTSIATIQNYLHKNPEYEEFLKRLFTKNLPIGVEAATVNKVYGEEIIPVWEVQQGYPIDKYKFRKGELIFASRKLNGSRGTYFKGDIISRQAQKFDGLDHIIKDIEKIIGTDYAVDGELIRRNIDGLTDGQNFRETISILNSDGNDKSLIKFVIFDIVPVDEFEMDACTENYSVRKKRLLDLKNKIQKNGTQNIEVVQMVYEGTDVNDVYDWLDYAVRHDWEGLVVNRQVPYRRTRHNGCLKVKRFYTVDLRITAIEEGQNRLAGTMGALVVDYKGNELRIGSGFDDATRAAVWANPDNYIGKIVECKYKEVTMDKKTGLESLQFPTFVRFRDDKNEVSYG